MHFLDKNNIMYIHSKMPFRLAKNCFAFIVAGALLPCCVVQADCGPSCDPWSLPAGGAVSYYVQFIPEVGCTAQPGYFPQTWMVSEVINAFDRWNGFTWMETGDDMVVRTFPPNGQTLSQATIDWTFQGTLVPTPDVTVVFDDIGTNGDYGVTDANIVYTGGTCAYGTPNGHPTQGAMITMESRKEWKNKDGSQTWTPCNPRPDNCPTGINCPPPTYTIWPLMSFTMHEIGHTYSLLHTTGGHGSIMDPAYLLYNNPNGDFRDLYKDDGSSVLTTYNIATSEADPGQTYCADHP